MWKTSTLFLDNVRSKNINAMFYLIHFFLQCQNDPSLEIKDEPEAWSVTVDKKVPVPKYFYTCLL